jgi:hypothetical protein
MAADDLRSHANARKARFLEWVVLCVLIGALSAVAWRQGQQVQDQAELVTFRATVRALTQALALRRLPGGAATGGDGNPFELLERKPVNYAGAMSMGQALALPPGMWVFDAGCGCVAYLPRDPQGLRNASGAPFIALKLVGPPGQSRLVPREPFVWLGQPLP